MSYYPDLDEHTHGGVAHSHPGGRAYHDHTGQVQNQHGPVQVQIQHRPGPVQIQQGPVPTVAPRSRAAAITMSIVLPGLGSMYGGEPGMGVVLLAAFFFSWLLVFVLIGIVLVPVVWAVGLWHAHHSVVQWNRAHGIIS
jgi:TM2 domain-containing membrane protein YozV